MFAAAAAAAVAAGAAERPARSSASAQSRGRGGAQAERALAELVADPSPFCYPREDRARVWLLFINLGSLQLAPNLGNARFQLRLRYGGSGRFREKFSQKVRSTPVVGGSHLQNPPQPGMLVEIHSMASTPELNGMLGVCESWCAGSGSWSVRFMSNELQAVRPENLCPASQVFANLDAMVVFPWSSSLPPQITFSLRKLGIYDTTISETTVTIPFSEGRPGVAEQEVLFLGRRGCSGFVGQLGVAAELRSFMRGDLLQGSPFPGALEEMLGSLELLRMPAGHLGPNSMAGRPATGTPIGPFSAAFGFPFGAPRQQPPVDAAVVVGRPVPREVPLASVGTPRGQEDTPEYDDVAVAH